jgi:hypothetical protein
VINDKPRIVKSKSADEGSRKNVLVGGFNFGVFFN